MDEADSEPTVEELSKAIDSLASGKAPGSDGIPRTYSSTARLPCFVHCVKSSASAGAKELYHRT